MPTRPYPRQALPIAAVLILRCAQSVRFPTSYHRIIVSSYHYITRVRISTEKMAGTQTLRTGTRTTRPAGGTKVTSIEIFSKERQFRPKQNVVRPQPKILSKVQELRLLSKVEQAGLLSLLEKQGITLSTLEKSGALSLAEKFGLLSAAADRNTPSALFTLASALLAAGPAVVYFVPDDSPVLVGVQVAVAVACVAGGSAAWGGASLLSTLQK